MSANADKLFNLALHVINRVYECEYNEITIVKFELDECLFFSNADWAYLNALGIEYVSATTTGAIIKLTDINEYFK